MFWFWSILNYIIGNFKTQFRKYSLKCTKYPISMQTKYVYMGRENKHFRLHNLKCTSTRTKCRKQKFNQTPFLKKKNTWSKSHSSKREMYVFLSLGSPSYSNHNLFQWVWISSKPRGGVVWQSYMHIVLCMWWKLSNHI